MTRRMFVIGVGASIPILSACNNLFNKADKIAATTGLNSEPWLTINSVYDHLLPAEDDGPSSSEINATGYLHKIFSSSKTSRYKKKLILKGPELVNSTSLKLFSRKFIELSRSEKEKTLREHEKTEDGEEFLVMLINNLFEALLGDPVYGCQPTYAGWQWLEHIPGFPRPTKPNPKVL